ncbi:MAG: multiheme c-type cytochrome [Campylobacterota bacterium]|nr:multiheme c-type cytochrome [Campylobacterota bacterium]
MKKLLIIISIFLNIYAVENTCKECHKGIEDIRDNNSEMMMAIKDVALEAGHPDNDCIICHGGNPSAKTKEKAHSGTIFYFQHRDGPKEFYPSPTSPAINKNTCGMCHSEQVSAQENSLMQTEQGKIQGALWSFGGKNGYNHNIGNYKTSNPKDPHKRLGSDIYKKYMQELSSLEPQVFPQEMKELPPAPTAEQVQKDPSLAVYTYLRQECLRCHTGAKGRSKRGDFRGVGCASCHIPYSNEGYYEGSDKSINKNERGHLLVHSIQSSRKTKVKVHDVEYSGIPVETCTTCHNRGKRIGVSYQGLMESAYNPTYDDKGNPQPKLHTKRYMHMKEDIHYKKGMLCQDCHTSNDMHGDGFLSGTTLAPVEIECQDCHGTTSAYPWELPLGYSDEFNTTAKVGTPRGVTMTLQEHLKKATQYDKKDGLLLSARGNPLTNVVRKGDEIVVHLASGKDIMLQPLKRLKERELLSKNALIAMDSVDAHTTELECYACHATWAPQCYGCHVKIDYSNAQQNIDWLKASHDKDIHGRSGDMKKDLREYLVDGKVSETRSYLRFEDPILGQNGEGRISPIVPGCQTTITVVGKDGETLMQNHIYKIPNVEGAGEDGQNAIDMSPIQPHTIQKESRSCESCHTNPKTMGYGINAGKDIGDQSRDLIVDLMSADKKLIPSRHTTQIPAIKNLKHEYSQVIDKNNTQLMTVGHHWTLSQPLNKKQLSKLEREGVCISCHQSIPDGNLGTSAMSHIAKMMELDIDNKEHSFILYKILNIGAYSQLLAVVVVLALAIYYYRKRRRS